MNIDPRGKGTMTRRMIAFASASLLLFGALSLSAEEKTGNAAPAQEKAVVKTAQSDPVGYRHPIRDPKNNIVTMETNMGKMTLELYRDVAPIHADSFVARTVDGFYKGKTFHRVIDNFMIQGGDPLANGTGDAGYKLKAEFSKLPHLEGTLSMARGPDPNSGSCQFFICLARQEYLDGNYTVFGHLIKGYDVLHKIGSTPVIGERPKSKMEITNIYLSDAEGNPLKKQ